MCGNEGDTLKKEITGQGVKRRRFAVGKELASIYELQKFWSRRTGRCLAELLRLVDGDGFALLEAEVPLKVGVVQEHRHDHE